MAGVLGDRTKGDKDGRGRDGGDLGRTGSDLGEKRLGGLGFSAGFCFGVAGEKPPFRGDWRGGGVVGWVVKGDVGMGDVGGELSVPLEEEYMGDEIGVDGVELDW